MEKQERLHRIQELLQAAGGEVESMLKLQKLAYLCQVAGTDMGQDFAFQYYDLYSTTLTRDVEAAIAVKLIAGGEGSGYRALVSKKQSSDVHGMKVVESIQSRDTKTLEVLATICYLHKVGYSAKEISEKLDQLKGDSRSHFPEAKSLANKCFAIDVRDLAQASR